MRHVGIVGTGVSGLALVTLMARDGWRVSVLERTADLGPVGAGFMLQHLGQQVTHRLGIGDALQASSAPIRRVDGATTRGRPTMQFAYGDGVDCAMAWGVHRGDLFTLLHDAAVAAGAVVTARCEVQGVSCGADGWTVADVTGRRHGPYDLVVGADGASSRVRSLASRDCAHWPADCPLPRRLLPMVVAADDARLPVGTAPGGPAARPRSRGRLAQAGSRERRWSRC